MGTPGGTLAEPKRGSFTILPDTILPDGTGGTGDPAQDAFDRLRPEAQTEGLEDWKASS